MRQFLRCLLPLIAAVTFDLPAAAAPQILLAIAADKTIPMRCDARHCEAEIGTICLQPDRSDPDSGTPYTLLDPQALEVVVDGPDGRSIAVPPTGSLRIVAARGHTAVRVILPRTLLARGDHVRPALHLKDSVIFTPLPTDGDPEPQTDADAALARTALRTLAAKVVDRQSDRARATAVILRAINVLPRHRAPTRAEHAMAEKHLRSPALPEMARVLVKEADGHCHGFGTTFIDQDPLFSYRGCLAVNHDTMLEEVFMDYRALLKDAPRS